MANSFLSGVKGDSLKINHRTSLNNNGKIYDGTTSYNYAASFANFGINQPFSILCTFTMPNLTGFKTLISTRTTQSADGFNRGIGIVIIDDVVGFTICGSGSGGVQRFLYFISAEKLKLGINIVQMTFEGGYNNINGLNGYINGKLCTKTNIVNTLVSTDVINPYNGISIGVSFNVSGGIAFYYGGKIRKAQIVNRVLTKAEARKSFNFGTLEGVIPDANFLLDVDFNKTGTSVPTTRASTPTYTFTNHGSTSYGSFY